MAWLIWGSHNEDKARRFLLVYYPKTIAGDAFDPKAVVAGETPVEIVPVGRAGALRLKILAHGQPLPKSEVTIILPDGTQQKLMTGEAGLTAQLTQTGRYGAWARYLGDEGRRARGKTFAETRNYATIVFDVPEASATASNSSAITATRYATLPPSNIQFRRGGQRRMALRVRRTYRSHAFLFHRSSLVGPVRPFESFRWKMGAIGGRARSARADIWPPTKE